MSDINVTVTNAGSTGVTTTNGAAYSATVGNGGAVNVAIGSVSPGNATVISGTLTINSVTTLSANQSAYVVNNGTAYAALLDIGIPQGLAGIQGPPGQNGFTPHFEIGNVATLSAGSVAHVVATTSNDGANVTLDFGLPRGADGASGANGTNITLSDAAAQPLGVAAAGTSSTAARADHVHVLPTIAYGNLSGVPNNFPSNIASVSGLQAALDAKQVAGNYVTDVNNITGSLTLAAGGNVTLTANGSTLTIASSAGGVGANDTIDGGYYVGVVGGIMFSAQPQSMTVSTNASITFSNVTNSPARYAVFSLGTNLYSLNVSNWLIRSSDDGATWSNIAATSISSANMSLYPPAALSNGTRTVIAPGIVGNGTSALFYSDDANLATLTALSAGAGYPDPRSLAYSSTAGRWVVAEAQDGGYPALYSSSNATTWTLRKTFSALANATGVNVVTCAGLFVAMPNNYDDYASSSDGISWTSATNPFTGPGAAIAIASSGSRAVAIQGTAVRVTTNGTTWESATLPAACQFIQYARNLFWAWPSNTIDVFTSKDGISWTTRELSKAGLRGLAVASGSNTAFLTYDSSISVNLSTQAKAVFSSSFASANFTVLASANNGATVSYQWQSSLDGGATWANIANQTTTALNLTGLTIADSGTRYRAQASAIGLPTKSSHSANLTVTE